MTEINELKNSSINFLVTGKDGTREVLLIGLKPGFEDRPQYQRGLKREYEQCQKIDHPNILKYLEMKEVAGYGQCIVMEWEPSRTLADYMEENHSAEEQKDIILQIANALNFLHQQGKVHGALDPSCIFITQQGDRVKLLNFRLRYADRLSEPTASMKFRAPEAKDGTVSLDARTDVFSLGMILKEMDLGERYENVVFGSSAIARNNRFPDIDAFLEAFEHHRHTRRRTTGMGKGGANSKRLVAVVAAIAALAVVVALAFFNRDVIDTEKSQPTSEIVDSTERTENPTKQPDGTLQAQETAEPTQSAAPANQTYTGDLAFLNELVPQMHIDMDKIYASSKEKSVIQTKLSSYYKGLRKALGNKTEEQFAAYDKAFMDYRAKKDAEQ